MTSVALAGCARRCRTPRIRLLWSADVRFFLFAKPGATYAVLACPKRARDDGEARGSDAAVPVGSWGWRPRVGGRAGGCPERCVGGGSTCAVSGDRLCHQLEQRLGVD